MKANVEQKRQVIRFVFDKLTLDEGNLGYTYTKPFELLSQAVEITNRSKMSKIEIKIDKIFELKQRIDESNQYDHFGSLHPAWLPGLDSNQRP